MDDEKLPELGELGLVQPDDSDVPGQEEVAPQAVPAARVPEASTIL